MDTSLPDSNHKPFVVLYRWRVRPGFEDQFVQGWRGVSRAYKRDRGALGARLHQGTDGLWYSYAVWPSAQKREEAFSAGSPDPAASALVKEATVECLPEIILDLVVDLLGSENDT
ncbi:antibiotic biosynthesis monooxygenase [Lysobacter sp. D1-1-M9]|uniref:antibiotic biosynthesis monooxygenase family protein n=1 Tax=Novilysobacter longmucuonensis TaxID=3098603 RepID=UPI002FC8D721